MNSSPSEHRGPSQDHLEVVQNRLNHLRSELQDALNNRPASFTWEIGCGHGHFLIKYASIHSTRLFVGIDLLSERLRKAAKKQQSARVENVLFFKAKAEEFLECLPSGAAIEEVLILFPDPWPKKRHHKNRLIQDSFLESVAARMLPHGKLYFRTDHEPYFEWTRRVIANHPSWELDLSAPWVLEEPTVFQKKATSFNSLIARLKTP